MESVIREILVPKTTITIVDSVSFTHQVGTFCYSPLSSVLYNWDTGRADCDIDVKVHPRKMCERVPNEEVVGGRFSILNSRLALATILSKVSGANFFLYIEK